MPQVFGSFSSDVCVWHAIKRFFFHNASTLRVRYRSACSNYSYPEERGSRFNSQILNPHYNLNHHLIFIYPGLKIVLKFTKNLPPPHQKFDSTITISHPNHIPSLATSSLSSQSYTNLTNNPSHTQQRNRKHTITGKMMTAPPRNSCCPHDTAAASENHIICTKLGTKKSENSLVVVKVRYGIDGERGG